MAQKTGPGMMRSRWWLNMYELDRDLERMRPMPSSTGGEEPICTPELETERLFWNQSRALPSILSVRDGRRLPNWGELERLSSLLIVCRKKDCDEVVSESASRVSVRSRSPSAYIRLSAEAAHNKHSHSASRSWVTYAHCVSRPSHNYSPTTCFPVQPVLPFCTCFFFYP